MHRVTTVQSKNRRIELKKFNFVFMRIGLRNFCKNVNLTLIRNNNNAVGLHFNQGYVYEHAINFSLHIWWIAFNLSWFLKEMFS